MTINGVLVTEMMAANCKDASAAQDSNYRGDGPQCAQAQSRSRRRWHDMAWDLEPRIEDLRGRVHRRAYRPQPSRRTYIPKADGKLRPLAIAALEDKVVQGAT